MLSDVEFMNMNMIRIFGGSGYENEFFYDECDKRGILVWQDFPFACQGYPLFFVVAAQTYHDFVQRLFGLIRQISCPPKLRVFDFDIRLEQAVFDFDTFCVELRLIGGQHRKEG